MHWLAHQQGLELQLGSPQLSGVLPVPGWVSSIYSSVFSQSKHMYVTGDSKLAMDVR